MNTQTSTCDEYEPLNGLVIQDFDLRARRFGRSITGDLDAIAEKVSSLARAKTIVYTAFDGDHLELCGHMRRYVLDHGHIPANPESILGYKDTVTARHIKRGVLLDDLGVLKGCNQLWVFTEEQPRPESLQDLAEGVVVEILYFLKNRQGAQLQKKPQHNRARIARANKSSGIYFISPSELLQGNKPQLQEYTGDYNQSKANLLSDQRDGVLRLINGGSNIDEKVSALVYYVLDPLDFKYATWVREHTYLRSPGLAPLVPGLALELMDYNDHCAPLGQALVGWAALARLARYAERVEPMDKQRTPSVVAAILEKVWLRLKRRTLPIESSRWADFQVPKALLEQRWPLTEHEIPQAT